MKKITDNKIIIIFSIIIILGIYLINQNYLKSKLLNNPLPEVKLKEKIEKEKTFAIMISDDGNNYQKYESNEWPNDKYKFKEAQCVDNNGNLVNDVVSFENGKITIKTDRTIYCTLYFDHKETIEILRENDINKSLSGDTQGLQGGMYRYQAAPLDAKEATQMTNWICFGTNDKSECTNEETGIDKYMYRIIGITKEGQMYLVKETFLKEESKRAYSWNDKYYTTGTDAATCDDKVCPEWNTSLLFKRINGTSNGTQKGSGTTLNIEWTDIFVDSSEYEYLKSGDSINGTKDDKGSKWYQLIANHDWMYGDTITGFTDEATYTGNIMYAIETGNADAKHFVGNDGNNTEATYRWNQSVSAKIGLMYIHDYIYSYYNGSDPDTRGNPKNESTAKNCWLFFQKDGYNNTSSSFEWKHSLG